jgi:hypothetical protein
MEQTERAVREQCAKEVEQEAERLCVRYMQLFEMAVQLRVP